MPHAGVLLGQVGACGRGEAAGAVGGRVQSDAAVGRVSVGRVSGDLSRLPVGRVGGRVLKVAGTRRPAP